MRGVLEEDRFSYDAVGNRLTDIEGRGYTYNNGNQLLSYGQVAAGFSLRYDANGNLIEKLNTATGETTTYRYDSENRLVQINTQPVTGNAQLVTYKYDPFGRRIEKNVNGAIMRYVYDREDILFELDGNNNIITEYLHGPGIDEPIAMTKNNQTYYYHADGLGSIIAITDSAGNVVQKYEYDSFGNITYQQDANFKQPYTYTGREYDEESGLYYYRARYYDARIGRFITSDPLSLTKIILLKQSSSKKVKNIGKGLFNYALAYPQILNKYDYVGSSPVNWVDPFGLIVQICRGPSDPFPLVDHYWLKTDTKEAGMGPAGGGAEDTIIPFGTRVEITDHSNPSRSEKAGSTCEEVKGVDEGKVNKELEIGKSLGRWSLGNNCNTFIWDVLKRSR